MLRFKSDLHTYPGFIYDTSTKNRSFVDVASKYKSMGVSNYAFCLVLLNSSLQGVDPHSKDLTYEQKAAIRVECQYNPWYFLREVARVVGQGGPDTEFRANRGNICAFWLFLCHQDFVLIQSRQTGKSIVADFILIWVLLFSGYQTNINLITLNDKLRVSNMIRIKKAIKLLPAYLRTTKGEKDNTEEVTYSPLGNRIIAHINSDSKDKARETARGQTAPINYGDEFAYWKWIAETFAAALGSSGAAVENAKVSGGPWGNFFATTAGKRDDRHGKLAYDHVSKGAIWSEAYFDALDEEDLTKRLTAAHHPGYTKFMVNCTFSYRQLGFTDEWAAGIIKRYGLSPDDADRDLFNVWTSGSASSALTIYLTRTIVGSIISPRYVENYPEGYNIRWYVPKQHLDEFLRTHHCVWGLDTSTANGKDAMALVLREVSTLRVIAVSTVSESFIMNYAKWLASVLVKYPNTTLVIERASTAESILEVLIVELTKHNINPFLRIYNKIISEYDTDSKEYRQVTSSRHLHDMSMYQYYMVRGVFGVNMNQRNREDIYGHILQTSASLAGKYVFDEQLAKEIVGLEMKNNRVDHSSGAHDDHVIAWLLSHWFLTKTRNLKRYSIDPSTVMRRCVAVEDEREVKQESSLEKAQRSHLRNEIEYTLKEMKGCNNPMLLATLETRLRSLSERSYRDGGEPVSIDTLIATAKEYRKRNLINKQTEQPVYVD